MQWHQAPIIRVVPTSGLQAEQGELPALPGRERGLRGRGAGGRGAGAGGRGAGAGGSNFQNMGKKTAYFFTKYFTAFNNNKIGVKRQGGESEI